MYNKYLYCKDIMKNIKKTQTRQIIFNTYVLLIFEYTIGLVIAKCCFGLQQEEILKTYDCLTFYLLNTIIPRDNLVI